MLETFGVPIKIKEQTVICLVSKTGIDTALEEGGFATTGAVTVRCRLAALATPKPVANDPLTLQGQRYKIHEILSEPDSLIVKYLATRR